MQVIESRRDSPPPVCLQSALSRPLWGRGLSPHDCAPNACMRLRTPLAFGQPPHGSVADPAWGFARRAVPCRSAGSPRHGATPRRPLATSRPLTTGEPRRGPQWCPSPARPLGPDPADPSASPSPASRSPSLREDSTVCTPLPYGKPTPRALTRSAAPADPLPFGEPTFPSRGRARSARGASPCAPTPGAGALAGLRPAAVARPRMRRASPRIAPLRSTPGHPPFSPKSLICNGFAPRPDRGA
jgi:hypothetical protein